LNRAPHIAGAWAACFISWGPASERWKEKSDHFSPAFGLTGNERVSMNIHTVLVVEDDVIQRRQMARILEANGYGVLQASDGMEAIPIIDSRKIDLVMTDLRMPFAGGISLLKYMKIFFPRVPVVVVTAYPGDIEDTKPDALLCKPFKAEELIYCIQRLTFSF
jgi:CheY-like chemotaxis protein